MKVFVGCSSSNQISNKHIKLSEKVGFLLSKYNHTLIFGASNNGAMGALYHTTKKYNGKVIGIISKTFIEDLKKLECNQIIETDNSYKRFETIEKEADLLLFIPGGIGTYTELFLALDMKRNNELNKPIIIFNYDNFYNPFIKIIDNLISNNFANESNKQVFTIIDNITQLETILKGNQ